MESLKSEPPRNMPFRAARGAVAPPAVLNGSANATSKRIWQLLSRIKSLGA